jgi:hypothetical protein
VRHGEVAYHEGAASRWSAPPFMRTLRDGQLAPGARPGALYEAISQPSGSWLPFPRRSVPGWKRVMRRIPADAFEPAAPREYAWSVSA